MQALLDFWIWYSGLFFDPDNKVRIAAWAATIATLSFVITIILIPTNRSLKRKFAKVKVEAGMSYQLIASAFGTNAGAPSLTVTVTNLTGGPIFIHNPTLATSKKVNGEDKFVVPKSPGAFPKRLESGEQFKQNYDTASLFPQILTHLSSSDKVGFTIVTTTGKSYKSNRFTKSHIAGHMKASAQFNR